MGVAGTSRFYFSHFTAVADEELQDIEDIINKGVAKPGGADHCGCADRCCGERISRDGVVREKYGDKVRVIKIGDFSTEFCGGTHTAATGEIGLIKILKEGSVSSGVRRVEAITGEGSLKHFRKDHQLENVVSAFVSPPLPSPPFRKKRERMGHPRWRRVHTGKKRRFLRRRR